MLSAVELPVREHRFRLPPDRGATRRKPWCRARDELALVYGCGRKVVSIAPVPSSPVRVLGDHPRRYLGACFIGP